MCHEILRIWNIDYRFDLGLAYKSTWPYECCDAKYFDLLVLFLVNSIFNGIGFHFASIKPTLRTGCLFANRGSRVKFIPQLRCCTSESPSSGNCFCEKICNKLLLVDRRVRADLKLFRIAARYAEEFMVKVCGFTKFL